MRAKKIKSDNSLKKLDRKPFFGKESDEAFFPSSPQVENPFFGSPSSPSSELSTSIQPKRQAVKGEPNFDQQPDARKSYENSNQISSGFTTHTIHRKIPFSVSIPRITNLNSSTNNKVASESRSSSHSFSESYNDSSELQESGTGSQMEKSVIQAPDLEPIDEPAVGETITIPPISFFESEEYYMGDAIASSISYSAAISQGGAPPRGFGITRPGPYTLSGVNITNSGGSFIVSGTVDNPVIYQVRASTGPAGQVNITGDSDSNITSSNYNTVASDLTPNMSNQNGKPPRTRFWAKDLTIVHEVFHAHDHEGYGNQGATVAQTWLNTQTASSAADVRRLLNQVPGRIASVVRAGMAYPAREERAYGDGAPLYRTRANAIKTKGDAGGY